MSGEQPLIFLSYSPSDRAFAERLVTSLEARDVRCLLDVRDLAPGRTIDEGAEAAISAAGALVLIPASGRKESKWQDREAEIARRSRKPIIWIKREIGSQASYGDTLPIDFSASFAKGVDDLLRWIDRKVGLSASEVATLPDPPRNFIGREQEVRTLCELLTATNQKIGIVAGEAGIGKTSLVAAVAKRLQKAKQFDKIVWINSHAISHADAVLLEVGRGSSVPETGKFSPESFVTSVLECQKLLIIIDGFDQAATEIRSAIANLLQLVIQSKGGSRVLVNSRSVRLNELVENASPDSLFMFSLGPLSEDEVSQMLSTGSLRSSETVSEITSWIRNLKLTQTPMLVSLIEPMLSRWQRNGDSLQLPTNIKQVIKSTLDGLDSQSQKILQMLAKTHPVRAASLSALLGLVDPKSIDQSLQSLCESRIIVNDGGLISFSHLLFLEFFKENDTKGAEGGRNEPDSQSRTLYVTFDPASVSKSDVIEVLDELNKLYAGLGGDELVIREESFGRFSQAGVLV